MAEDSVQKIRGFRHLMLNDMSASGFRQIKPILHFHPQQQASEWHKFSRDRISLAVGKLLRQNKQL